MMLYVFVHSLIGKIYKILPLKEEADRGQDVHLHEYLCSLLRDLAGACDTFPELEMSPEYITILNTIQYLSSNEFGHKACKQEVFKMIELLTCLEKHLGGEDDA